MDICDFHSHILPGVDHGSSSLATSREQLMLARQYGVSRVIATSHFYPHKDSVEQFIARRNAGYNELVSSGISDLPDIRLGAEILLCPNIDRLPGLPELSVHGTNTLLIELPFNDFGREYVLAVGALVAEGYKVVLAHAECYDPEHIETMLEYGVKLQLNASALVPLFRARRIKDWFRRGKVVAIGSDIHNADKNAYRMFSVARRRLGKYSPYVERCSNEIWNASSQL